MNIQVAESLNLPDIGTVKSTALRTEYKKAYSTDTGRLEQSDDEVARAQHRKIDTWNDRIHRPHKLFFAQDGDRNLKRSQSKSASVINNGIKNLNSLAFSNNVTQLGSKGMRSPVSTNIWKDTNNLRVVRGSHKFQQGSKKKSEISNDVGIEIPVQTDKAKTEFPIKVGLFRNENHTDMVSRSQFPGYSPIMKSVSKPKEVTFNLRESQGVYPRMVSLSDKHDRHLEKLIPLNQQIQAIQRDLEELDNRFHYYEAKIGRKL